MLKYGIAWPTVKSLFWLLLAIAVFFWNIVFTSQFSMLTVGETVNQAYSWFHFWAEGVRRGSLPLWDPYAFGGRSYIGEMQTAAFYPLHVALALFPFNRSGLLAPQLYHLYFVFAHVMAAYFMFALIRQLGLNRFPAMVAGLCYSIGGIVGGIIWPHLLESSVWLPLLFLLLLRALQVQASRRSLLYAALAGLTLGMSILAGGLHIVMMQVIVMVTAVAYYTVLHRNCWRRAALVVGLVSVTGLAGGAVQLLPSIEYSARAIRHITGTGLPATQKIPIAYLTDYAWPRTAVGYLVAWNFQGKMGPGEVLVPYLGTFPLLLATIGIWRYRDHLWVRYSAGLVLAAFLFSLGASSLLYGVIYALVPLLWMAREASRFLYLAHFGLAILAAYGTEALFYGTVLPVTWSPLNRVLQWLAIASAIVLSIPALFGKPELKPWTEWSLMLIMLTYPLFLYVARGGRGSVAQFLVGAFIVFDLHAFNAVALNKIEVARTGTDQLERLISMRGAAQFLKSLPGLFRVQVAAEPPLNLGDAYGIETVNGGAVTTPVNFMDLMSKGGPGINLLNVRYFLKPATASDPNPIYADANWKVYENSNAYPRAWIEYDGPARARGSAEASIQEHSSRHIGVKVRAASHGVLVLSEMFYPGWSARVNGTSEPIFEVEGGLRGIAVPEGVSEVEVNYAPVSVMVGGFVSGLTFTLILFAGALALFRCGLDRSERKKSSPGAR